MATFYRRRTAPQALARSVRKQTPCKGRRVTARARTDCITGHVRAGEEREGLARKLARNFRDIAQSGARSIGMSISVFDLLRLGVSHLLLHGIRNEADRKPRDGQNAHATQRHPLEPVRCCKLRGCDRAQEGIDLP